MKEYDTKLELIALLAQTHQRSVGDDDFTEPFQSKLQRIRPHVDAAALLLVHTTLERATTRSTSDASHTLGSCQTRELTGNTPETRVGHWTGFSNACCSICGTATNEVACRRW